MLSDIRLWINDNDKDLLATFTMALELLRTDKSSYVQTRANQSW